MRLLLLSALLAACSDSTDPDFGGDGGTADDSGAGDGGDDGGGDDGGTGTSDWVEPDPSVPAVVADGQVTWTLSFDEEAEGNGFTDCTYSRTFSGVQVLDLGYLCADCDVIVQGTATMTEGLDDCYSQISSDPQEVRTELWGWSQAGGFYRSGREQYTLGELTDIETPAEDTEIALWWESEYTLEAGGEMILSAVGSYTYATDADTLLVEAWPDRSGEPYACGWPQENPGTLTLDYNVAAGETFPNVRLVDQCGEKLALWDLYGRYLVLDTSQSDCGPCRTMASEAEAWVEEMADDGIDVMVVSLLGNGLSDPFGTPDEDTHTEWVESYDLTDPVLYDRGFAYALFPGFIEDYSGEDFGYPTWLVVDPQMNLIHGNVGFGSWDDVGDVIRDDLGG